MILYRHQPDRLSAAVRSRSIGTGSCTCSGSAPVGCSRAGAPRSRAPPGRPWMSTISSSSPWWAAFSAAGWVMCSFYGLSFWTAQNPWYPFEIWDGGMSFHGGFIGAILALALFAWRRGRSVADVWTSVAAAGARLFFGRIGNFINGELWGKVDHASLGLHRRPCSQRELRTARRLRSSAVAALRGLPRRNRALHRHVVVYLESAPAAGAFRALPRLYGSSASWSSSCACRTRNRVSRLGLADRGPGFVIPDGHPGVRIWLTRIEHARAPEISPPVSRAQ